MKRAAIGVVILIALVVGGWILFQEFKTNVDTIVEERAKPAPRVVSESWPFDRFSPGHSEHVLNRELECNDCHDPSKPDFSGVDMGVCTSCHEEQAQIAHMGSAAEPTACFDCHSFKFDSPVARPWDCVRCHGPFDARAHEGLAMHDTIACSNCHHPHEPVSDTLADCTSCHEDIALHHGRTELSGTCTDCHGGHKLATDAASCMQCHQTEQPRVALTATFGGGHDSCASCHRAHTFSKTTAVQCSACHEGTITLAANKAAAHDDCTSCHSPHAVRAVGDTTCERCHANVASTHPATEGKTCISCHEPHPQRVAQISLRCSDCHDEAATEHSFHAQAAACIDCHEQHSFDLASLPERELCIRCHREQIRLTSRNEGHASCESCHTGTAHALGNTVGCDSCHHDILASSPPGHQECATCHEPHQGRVAAHQQCTSCHVMNELPGLHRLPEPFETPGHNDCTACHDIHESRARADRATCMTCHKDIAEHEPDAKRCTGCHTFISGRGH